jgi:hypothetical protein
MSIVEETVRGVTLSEAWLNAVIAVTGAPDRQHGLFHLVTRIGDPVGEQPEIRAAADALVSELGYNSVETVANTIFPAQLAATSRDHHHLADRYRRVYPTLRRLDRGNRNGTYFGRIVAHPAAGGVQDQLAELVRRLDTELRTPGPKSARYEMAISEPADLATPEPGGGQSAELPVHVYAAGQDNSAMGFPCLSFCSFQLDQGRLHMVAHYRRQHLIARGYGNYLGLGRLLGYVSETIGLMPGELMIVAGAAEVDAPAYRIRQLTGDALAG